MNGIKKLLGKLEWYINARPYRYIVYSMILNLLESMMLFVILYYLFILKVVEGLFENS
ncbi:unnamed protein product [marine sediment metagenome]|uniref:Uncharacterized protein n=1 Tax=marine sediment metagenome TaxID=412755 RepID=X1FDP9_9ZZZZ